VDCAEIGRQVGTSRHALLGYAHRRNWPPHPNGSLAGGERKPQKSHHKAGTVPAKPKPKRAPNALRVACKPEPLAVPTATFRTCQWPLGERPYRFCDQPAAKGAWCEAHHRAAYVHRSTLERAA
jgi:hypothetical protein